MEVVEEVWVDIKDAEGYSISSFGLVMNKASGKLIKPQLTPNGIVYVPLYVNGEKVTRSVKVMVANAFVEGKTNMFDTAINKDGNKMNNRADNLVWRPRWYAIKYSRQFRAEFPHSQKGPVQDSIGGEIFETIYVAGVSNGLLFKEIFTSCRTGAPVFPTAQVFVFT